MYIMCNIGENTTDVKWKSIFLSREGRFLRAKVTKVNEDNILKQLKYGPKDFSTEERYVDKYLWKDRALTEATKGNSSNLTVGRGVKNIIVIDTSESMRGEGIWQARYVVLSLLDEFENTPFRKRKENVAIITCGYRTRILQHLTCNYEAIKHCLENIICGGSSPLLAELMFCRCFFQAITGKTITYNYSGWRVHPRIIVISDGRATDSFHVNGPESCPCDKRNEVKSILYAYTEKLKQRIYCVPVGKADREVLGMLSALSNGRLVEIHEVRTHLGRHYSNFTLAERLHIENISLDWTRVSIEDIRQKLGSRPERSDRDLEAIKEILLYKTSPDCDDSDGRIPVSENPEMPPIGSRVRRGPDWRWGNQDTCGVGTVTAHYKNGWLRVVWDNDSGYPYRFGHDNAIDLTTVDEPRVPKCNHEPCVGCKVTRGPHWEWDDQDGGPGNVGIIYLIDKHVVYVRWSNGHKGNYRYNYDGKYDVQLSWSCTEQ